MPRSRLTTPVRPAIAACRATATRRCPGCPRGAWCAGWAPAASCIGWSAPRAADIISCTPPAGLGRRRLFSSATTPQLRPIFVSLPLRRRSILGRCLIQSSAASKAKTRPASRAPEPEVKCQRRKSARRQRGGGGITGERGHREPERGRRPAPPARRRRSDSRETSPRPCRREIRSRRDKDVRERRRSPPPAQARAE